MLPGRFESLVPANLNVVAIVDRIRFRNLAAVSVKRLVPGRGDASLLHGNGVVYFRLRPGFGGFPRLALVPGMRRDFIFIVSVGLVRPFASVSLNDV